MTTRALSLRSATQLLFRASGPLLLATAFASACGGGTAAVERNNEPPPPPPATAVHARGDSEVVATIGPAGGTLELGNGFRVEIPEDALEAETEFHFTNGAAANVFHPEEGETQTGEVVELTPFAVAVTGHMFRVSAPMGRVPTGFEEAEVVLGMEEEGRGRAFGDAVVTRWQYHPASSESSRLVAEVGYFGGHRLQFGLLRDE